MNNENNAQAAPPPPTCHDEKSEEVCYFCSHSMPSNYIDAHAELCGSILEECPRNCGAYVERRDLCHHLRRCLAGAEDNNLFVEENDEVRSAWTEKVTIILNMLRNAVNKGEEEVKELRSTLISSLMMTNEMLRDDVLDNLIQNRTAAVFTKCQLSNLEVSHEQLMNDTDERFKYLSSRLFDMKLDMNDLRRSTDLQQEVVNATIQEMKTRLVTDYVSMYEMWEDEEEKIAEMKRQLDSRCNLSKDLVDRYKGMHTKISNIEIKLQSLSEQFAEHVKDWELTKTRILETVQTTLKSAKKLEQSTAGSKLNFHECNCGVDTTSFGRLIWRIDNYREKFEEAKRRGNCVLFSPKFYSKEYGYTLRMELYLNGLGHWKNRHIIGCLRIVPGKWDPLLSWPCRFSADVILKDQLNPMNDLRKFVRTVKKERNEDDDDGNSNQDMFIPHDTLDRQPGYTAENVMFLEIRLRDQNFSGSTLTLAQGH